MPDFLEEDYELKKNSGPRAEKCHTRNRVMDHVLKHVPTYCHLIKLYHINPKLENLTEDEQFKLENHILADDFTPCVLYSLNKKARWEMITNIGAENLQKIQDENGGLDTIILERRVLNYMRAWWLQYVTAYQDIIYSSKCKTSHKLEKNEASNTVSYEKRTVKGKGHYYPSFRKCRETKEERETEDKRSTIVTYNVVTVPENYKRVFDGKCRKGCGFGYVYPVRRNSEKKMWWIDHVVSRKYSIDDVDAFENIENDCEDGIEYKNEYAKCYKLEEHIISKTTTKSIKNRNRNGSVLSGYSITSSISSSFDYIY